MSLIWTSTISMNLSIKFFKKYTFLHSALWKALEKMTNPRTMSSPRSHTAVSRNHFQVKGIMFPWENDWFQAWERKWTILSDHNARSQGNWKQLDDILTIQRGTHLSINTDNHFSDYKHIKYAYFMTVLFEINESVLKDANQRTNVLETY